MAKTELTIEQIKDAVEAVVERKIGALRAEMNEGFGSVLAAFDRHMHGTDVKFMSDRKRIERLERIILN